MPYNEDDHQVAYSGISLSTWSSWNCCVSWFNKRRQAQFEIIGCDDDEEKEIVVDDSVDVDVDDDYNDDDDYMIMMTVDQPLREDQRLDDDDEGSGRGLHPVLRLSNASFSWHQTRW